MNESKTASFRATTTTLMPWLANLRVIAAPMPELPPVTKAVYVRTGHERTDAVSLTP